MYVLYVEDGTYVIIHTVRICFKTRTNTYWSGHIPYCTQMYVLCVQDTFTIVNVVRICTYLYVYTYKIRTSM